MFYTLNMNNVNLKAIEETKKKLEKGEAPEYREFTVEGEWLLEGDYQFKAQIDYPKGSLTLYTDQPPPSGGKGNAPNPVQYCIFSAIACYATTFMSIASEMGVSIERFRIKGTTVVDMKSVMGMQDTPVVRKVVFELDVKADNMDKVREIVEIANRKCPAAYTITNPVELEVKFRT